MEINDNFRVSTPIDATWKVMLDIEGIAPCLPGAQLQEVEGDEYRGIVKVKVGPITAQYKGTAPLAEVDEADPPARHRRVRARHVRPGQRQGHDRGDDDARRRGTKVDVATDLSITGKVAQFGRGVLVDVSSKLMGQFVENIERDVLEHRGGGDTSHAGPCTSKRDGERGVGRRRGRSRTSVRARKIESPRSNRSIWATSPARRSPSAWSPSGSAPWCSSSSGG